MKHLGQSKVILRGNAILAVSQLGVSLDGGSRLTARSLLVWRLRNALIYMLVGDQHVENIRSIIQVLTISDIMSRQTILFLVKVRSGVLVL